MPSPSLAKTLLPIPFQTGLSQKKDPRWLEPGAALTAQNAFHYKANALGKRTGFTILSTLGFYPDGSAAAMVDGRQLLTLGDGLSAIGADTFTDSLWNFDEASGRWLFADRVPEVYVLPDRTVGGFADVVREYDTAIGNGYAVHVCMATVDASDNEGAVWPSIWFAVENATTGQTILPQQSLAGAVSTLPSFLVGAPKLAVAGTSCLLGYMTATAQAGGAWALALALRTLDLTKPWDGWSAATVITGLVIPADLFANEWTTTTNPSLSLDFGTWDLAVLPSVAGNNVVGICYQLQGRPNQITYSEVFTSSPPAVLTTISCNDGDAGYVTDNGPYLVAMGLDLSGTPSSGLIGLAYAYQLLVGGSVELRVKVQTRTYSVTAPSYSSAIDLMATPGPIDANGFNYPHAIAIANAGGIVGNYRVAWSPQSARWDSLYTTGPQGKGTATPGVSGGSATNESFIAAWSVLANQGNPMLLQTGPQPSVTYGAVVASRYIPDVNGLGYIIARLVSDEQGSHYLFADDGWRDFVTSGGQGAAWTPMRQVATLGPRLASTPLPVNDLFSYFTGNVVTTQFFQQDAALPHVLCHVPANPSAGAKVYQGLVSMALGESSSQNPTLIQFDFNSDLAYQSAVLGKNALVAGGCPGLTEGAHVHEAAFPYYPAIFFRAPSDGVYAYFKNPLNPNPGEGLAQGQVFLYLAIYEWVDDAGQVHRSGRSTAVEVNTNAIPAGQAAYVQLSVLGLGFTGKQKTVVPYTSGVRPQLQVAASALVRLFRTEANGDLFFEVGSAPAPPGVPYITFTDILGDDQITTNDLVYGDGLDGVVQGSILDNLTPPSFQVVCTHKNRFFGADGNNIWASKVLVDGEGAGFNELMAQSWNDSPDPITALASLDDKLVVFKRGDVGYLPGEGPEDDGSQNDWGPVQRIATDLGAIDWRSVVVKGDGVYFMSDAGLRMLTRDLQVVPVPQVEDVLEEHPTVTAALVHPYAGRISMQASSSAGAGVRIDHNYVLDTWTTSQTGTGPTAAISAAVADVPVSGDLTPTYHWMDAEGVVYRESASSYFDEAAFVPMQFESAWIKSEGIAGFARFRRLLATWQNNDPHALSVYVAFDYAETYYLMGTVTATMMQAMPGPLCQQLFALPRQRAEAVRFKIVDAADAELAPVTGQGPTLISLDLEVATYTNARTNRLPPAQRS